MNRRRAIQFLGVFFLAMYLLTILSRSMDSFRVVQVKTEKIQKTVIGHSVSGSGKVESTRQQGVFTVPEMKVTSLAVQEGDSVKSGDLLLEVDLETLKKKQSALLAEIEKAKLTQADAQEQVEQADKKRQEAIAHAQKNYDQTVASADQSVAWAQQDLDLAYDKWNQYQSHGSEAFTEDGQEDEQQREALRDEIWEKEKALESAATEREKNIAQARQALEDASQPVEPNRTAQVQQVEVEQKQKELEQVNALLERDGKVYAPAGGTVVKWNVKTGSLISEEAVLLLAEKTKTYQLTASVDASLQKYLDVGAEAELTGADGQALKDTATVKNIQSNEEDASLLDVTFSVPSSQVQIGESLEFELTKESRVYSCCLPLTALYQEDSKYYVYVVEEEDSVLGKVQKVRKVTVEVEEKNETTAALKEGVLTKEQQIVVESQREIQGGSRVRLEES